MLWALLGYLAASFIMTAMLAQLFPDGRFPMSTILLVFLAATLGAWAGDHYLGSMTIFTGGLVGAGLVSGGLLFILHRAGLLVQEPWTANPEDNEER